MNISFASAGRVAGLIKSGQISALEAADFYIARIEAFDDAINAVVVRDFERARARAKTLDRARKKLAKLPPLYGVPMTVKESYDLAGLPTTWGKESARDNIPAEDALAIQRLKAAGAVVLGKTNVPVMLADWQSFNPLYGTTSNRDPAHYCGVYAHKPTYGICPPRGYSLAGNLAPTDISCIGPMARSAKDLATALGVMAGPEAIDAGWRLDLPKTKIKALRGLRVAMMTDHEICPVESEIAGALRELGKFLKKSGAKVDFAARPAFDAQAAYENYLLLLNAALSARMPDSVLDRMRQTVANTPETDRSAAALSARGNVIEHRLWLRVNEERAKMRAAWAEFFKDFDVLISPVAASAAVAHDHSGNMGERSILVNGKTLNVADQLFWAGYSCNFYLPSTAAPLGMTAEGLPYGMQIIGAPFADYTTIAVAALLEKAWMGFLPPPAYDI